MGGLNISDGDAAARKEPGPLPAAATGPPPVAALAEESDGVCLVLYIRDWETGISLSYDLMYFNCIEKPSSPADASLLNKLLRSKLLETTNDVEIQRKDPNSPLYSVKSFEELRL